MTDSTESQAERDAMGVLESTQRGRRALELLARVAHLSAGERIALGDSWQLRAGGPRTREFHADAACVDAALDTRTREALLLLVQGCREHQQAQAAEQARGPWDLAYWAAVATLARGLVEDAPAERILRTFTSPLEPFPDRMASTMERTTTWLSSHVGQVNDAAFDGEELAPPLSDAQLARVTRWLEALPGDSGVLWPGAPRSWPTSPGEMPPITVQESTESGLPTWNVTVPGVGVRHARTRPLAMAEATAMLQAFAGTWVGDKDADRRLVNLVAWVRRLQGPSLAQWLQDVTD